ncbi:MAG TPA: AMP-binding protein, partial [Mycobacterium sp.]|nr:AMP-binding protein [Mycobacterium sp.]
MDLSIVSGPQLAAEPGLGALTLPGFLREVTASYGEREALAFPDADGVTRWTYAELWDRAIDVARALHAGGLGKGERVGVLMTNRPEWIAAVFGISIAGGVAAALSTFSTGPELDHLLASSCVSVLLFERTVGKKDFAAVLTELEPSIGAGTAGPLRSARYPFLRRLVVVGEPAPGVETWDEFLAHGADQPRELVEATAAAVQPSDPALLFFSSGSTSKPKGVLNAHRGVCIQMWRFRRMYGFGPDDH